MKLQSLDASFGALKPLTPDRGTAPFEGNGEDWLAPL